MYIWENQIKSVKGEKITFTDWTTAEYSEDYIKHLSTEEKQTLDKLYTNKVLKMQSDILKVFVNASASKSEISATLWSVSEDIARHEKNIISDLTGVNNYFDISFREINKLALKIQDKDFTN